MKITFALLLACLPYLCHCHVTNDTSYCDNCTQVCMEEELPPYSECPDPDICGPSEGNNVGLAFGLTIGAGFATNIGAILSFLPCFKRNNVTLLAISLALAAGFMVYIAFVDILGKTGDYFCCHTQEHATLATTGCFFLGILLTILLQFFLDGLRRLDITCCRLPWSSKKKTEGEQIEEHVQDGKQYSSVIKSLKSKLMTRKSSDGADIEKKATNVPSVFIETEKSGETKFNSTTESEIVIVADKKSNKSGEVKSDSTTESEIVVMADKNSNDCENPEISAPVDPQKEHKEVMELLGKDFKDLHRMGLFTAAAIAIHNFPEGIAAFVVGLATPRLGIALAIAIAVHNIPEGASVSIPIYYATGKKWKGLLWAFLSGISEPFGALLAFLIFKDIFGPLAYGFIFGLVGGMMVIVALKDLLPTARKFDKHGMVITSFFILGMFIMAASLIIFEYSG